MGFNDILNSWELKGTIGQAITIRAGFTGYVKKEIAEKLGLSLQPFVVTAGMISRVLHWGQGLSGKGWLLMLPGQSNALHLHLTNLCFTRN
jgi:hypothetical protein